jgi:hypothetical protein
LTTSGNFKQHCDESEHFEGVFQHFTQHKVSPRPSNTSSVTFNGSAVATKGTTLYTHCNSEKKRLKVALHQTAVFREHKYVSDACKENREVLFLAWDDG